MLMVIAMHSINLTLIKAHFDFNRDYIAKNLCVNRFNPDSDCKGQCVLMQKLTNQAEKEAGEKAVFTPICSFSFFHQENEVFDLSAAWNAVSEEYLSLSDENCNDQTSLIPELAPPESLI